MNSNCRLTNFNTEEVVESTKILKGENLIEFDF